MVRPTGWWWEHFTVTSERDRNGRYDCHCSYCGKEYRSAKTGGLRAHLESCTKVPQDVKAQLLEQLSKQIDDDSRKQPVHSRAQLAQFRSSNSGNLAGITASFAKVTPKLQQEGNQKLLRCFVASGSAFNMANNEFFLDWVYHLSPEYVVPGNDKLMELLLAEYAKVKAQNRATVEHAQDISMSIDNWTTLTQQSVCACNLKLPDGETLLWDVHDFSHDRHSGVNIKGRIIGWYDDIGPERMGINITDNDGGMQLGRNLAADERGYKHILGMR